MGVLDEILAHKRREVAARKTERPVSELITASRARPPARDFDAGLRPTPGHPVRLIAEVKRASPSQGVIDSSADPVAQARAYHAAGAAAVSVLTDEKYFRGRLEDLEAVRPAIGVTRFAPPAPRRPAIPANRNSAH